jgi:hypothetical protein
MKRIVLLALLVVFVLPALPAAVEAAGGEGPVTAGMLTSSGEQGLISPQSDMWYQYDVGDDVEQVEFSLHFWPSDEVRYQQVRLELYTSQQADADMVPMGEGFSLNRQEQSLSVGRRVWMGWLVRGTYYIHVVNESPAETFNYMVNSGTEEVATGSPADTSAPLSAISPSSGSSQPATQPLPLLKSGVLGLKGLRPPAMADSPPNSIDAILENSSNLYPADASWMYEVQHGRVRYEQIRWYKIEIGDKQERLDLTMHFWPSNGNIYNHVFFGVFTDYRLRVWKDGGAFQAIGLGGDTGFEEDRALVMNKKVWRGDLPHGVHYVGVWMDTDLRNPELGIPNVDFVDFLMVPTFTNQPNLPLPVTNIPEWLAQPLATRVKRSGVLAGPRLTRPEPKTSSAAAPSAAVQPPQPQPGDTTLRDTAGTSLAPHTNQWYKYDVMNKDGERLTVSIDWKHSDGNTFHQVGFGVFDRFQFDTYLRDGEGMGFGLAGTTGLDADYGPPVSRKVWKGVLPKGTYFIRVYNDASSDMDYTIRVARQ